jgi:hypothetical protein
VAGGLKEAQRREPDSGPHDIHQAGDEKTDAHERESEPEGSSRREKDDTTRVPRTRLCDPWLSLAIS